MAVLSDGPLACLPACKLILPWFLFQDFPNTRGQLPVEYLFDLFGPLQPRAFSLASSAKVSLYWNATLKMHVLEQRCTNKCQNIFPC